MTAMKVDEDSMDCNVKLSIALMNGSSNWVIFTTWWRYHVYDWMGYYCIDVQYHRYGYIVSLIFDFYGFVITERKVRFRCVQYPLYVVYLFVCFYFHVWGMVYISTCNDVGLVSCTV